VHQPQLGRVVAHEDGGEGGVEAAAAAGAPARAGGSRTPARWATLPDVTLLSDLDGFYTEHRRCGELDGGVDDVTVWLACDRGAAIARRADAGNALDVNG
jgi:hypothetical protein